MKKKKNVWMKNCMRFGEEEEEEKCMWPLTKNETLNECNEEKT